MQAGEDLRSDFLSDCGERYSDGSEREGGESKSQHGVEMVVREKEAEGKSSS